MKYYIIRRLIVSLPLLLGISFLTFMLFHLAPGNYFDTLRLNPQISEETIKRYEEQFHLNEPPLVQYGYWLMNLCKGELGYSFVQQSPVSHIIASRLFNTLLLGVSAMLVSWLVALPIGVYCAVHQHSWSDRILSAFSFTGISFPTFFLALLLLYILGSTLGLLPLGGMTKPGHEALPAWERALDIAQHLFIPTIVLSFSTVAYLQRYMRGNLLEALRAQYVTTARAKGLSERRVIYLHSLRNAINPMITLFGYELSSLLSGAALTEIICAWPGLGSLMLTAVMSQDLFLVMGSMLMGAAMLIGGNLLADILLAVADPRIKYQ